jgi:hypothetical protein
MMHAKITHPKVHLITYSTPVTKRMMAFNNLTYFSMPRLPEGWAAPPWLKTELGLLAGRLYFEWNEHDALCKFLGVQEDEKSPDDPMALDSSDDEEEEDDALASGGEDDVDNQEGGDKEETATITAAPKKRQTVTTSFSPRPLTFLQQWLAVRRHGQDFVHTPMGFLTQGKALQASHPFFGDGQGISTGVPAVDGTGLNGTGVGGSGGGGRWEGDDDGQNDDDGGAAVFDGVDDMGANVGGDAEGDDEEAEEVVYDDSEWFDSDRLESETDSESG